MSSTEIQKKIEKIVEELQGIKDINDASEDLQDLTLDRLAAVKYDPHADITTIKVKGKIRVNLDD